jgi:hypothetical protein
MSLGNSTLGWDNRDKLLIASLLQVLVLLLPLVLFLLFLVLYLPLLPLL